MFRSEKNAENLGVKEEPYWDFVEVDNYICPIFHNQINLGNNVFHHLLYYSNENIEQLLVNEDKAHNSLLLVDSAIDEKVDVSDEGKELNSFKNIRKNDRTTRTHI